VLSARAVVSTQVAMKVITTCIFDISTTFFITQHSRLQKYFFYHMSTIIL